MDDTKEHAAKRQAERAFKQIERKGAGAKSISEYEVEGLAVRANTVRLKALRLDKAAREKANADTKKKPEIMPTKNAVQSRDRPAGKKAGTKAAEMAGAQIDRLADRSATHDEQTTRKRRLLKGPKEFRNMRTDHPS